jgi:putative N6-adenine-specific DNA methylase
VKLPEYGLALCALGLEKVCRNEIERIGLAAEGKEAGRVRFSLGPPGGAAALMRANLCLRSAERVLIEAGRFHAENFDELFESVRALPWELYFRRDDRLVIERVRLHDSKLAAQTSVQSVVHKAVYDRLGKVYNLSHLPESGQERSLRVYIDSDHCLLGLDSSGEALHKRGYRRSTGEAPLKETIAAGVMYLAGWSRRSPLFDPFCGTGTIAIEAALFAMDRAPGLGRAFALESFPFSLEGGGRSVSDEIEAAKARVRRDADFRIVASDADPRALEAARANAARAGVAAGIEFGKAKAEDAVPPYESGHLICNPPYGERMGSVEEAEALYKRLGETASRFAGWGLGFVTNRFDFGDFFGRYAPTAKLIVNGAEEQWFHWYPAGSESVTGKRPEGSRPERSRRPEARRTQSEDARRQKAPRASSSGASPRPEGSRRTWVGPDKPGWKSAQAKHRQPKDDQARPEGFRPRPEGSRSPEAGQARSEGFRPRPEGSRSAFADRSPKAGPRRGR